MFKTAKLLFLTVETPLHAGSGNDLGIVDMPIQREKHTDFPKIEASGLKGSLREIFESQGKKGMTLPDKLRKEFSDLKPNDKSNDSNYKNIGIARTFGPDDGNEHAGALGFTDARLLLFPVKSVKGLFAWITCPSVLERFKNDLSLVKDFDASVLSDLEKFANTIPEQSGLIINEDKGNKDKDNKDNQDNKIILEEYTFEVKKDNQCTKLCAWLSQTVLPEGPEYDFWQKKMMKDIAVLSDEDFRDFVTLSTEVIARTKINNNTGTVEDGGLWYEEYLPSDSILYTLVLASPLFIENKKPEEKEAMKIFPDAEKVMYFFETGLPSIIQIGGNATIGKGLVRTRMGG